MKEDWIEVELGEVCEIISGRNQKEVINSDGEYPIYGSGGIFGYADKYLCEPGTTIIGRKGTINSPIFVNEKFWNVDTAFGISPKHINNPKYNYYFCLGFNFKNLDKSTTIPSLAKSDLLKIKFPLAPLPIQRAIVLKIENLFASLDKGIADLKTAQEQLKVYRQAVLKKAFDFNTKKEHSKLFEDRIDVLANIIDPQPSHRTPPVVLDGVPYVSTKDCDYGNDEIFFESARKVSSQVLEEHLNRYTLEIGDFIIGKIGTIGQPVRIKLPQNYTLSANIVLIQPRKINKKFLYYFFQSNLVEIEFKKGQKATAQAAFGIQKVRAMKITYPDAVEQEKVVAEIETRLSVCDKVEQSISEALEKAEALRQSILKKAFEGKLLTKAEIAKCKQEVDYQPASELLKKIKAEKK